MKPRPGLSGACTVPSGRISNGSLKSSFADTESVTNYHKYGCYGTLNTGAVTVKWRAARFYKDKGKHLVTVKTEHKATLDTMRDLERDGFEVTYLDVLPTAVSKWRQEAGRVSDR